MTEEEKAAFRDEIRTFLARELTPDLQAIAELNFSQGREIMPGGTASSSRRAG